MDRFWEFTSYLEEYLSSLDKEEGISSNPSFGLVENSFIGYEKRINNIIVHYAGMHKDFREYSERKTEILDSFFETIVSDPKGKKDSVLKEFLERLCKTYKIIDPQNFENREGLKEKMSSLAIDLAKEVGNFFGGFRNFELVEVSCKERIETLKKTTDNNLIYLGDLQGCGVCRHRSILYKLVCDTFGIPCQVLRGHFLTNEGPQPHLWNEIRVVEKVGLSLQIVDTTIFQGFVEKKYHGNYQSSDRKKEREIANRKTIEHLQKDYEGKKGIVLGNGSFGIVYGFNNSDYFQMNLRGELEMEKADLAVKEINITKLAHSKVDWFKCVRKEVETMEHLKHRNIVEIIGHFQSTKEENRETQKIIHIVMKRYTENGLYIQRLMNSSNILTPLRKSAILLQYFIEINRGLEFIHSQGKVHYDIKPQNILVVWDHEKEVLKEVRISDFGSTKEKNFHLQLTTEPHTTPKYRAPELSNDLKVFTSASDIYSYGVMMKENIEHLEGFSSLERIFEKCLVENPIERPSLMEIRYILRSALYGIVQQIYRRELNQDPLLPVRSDLLKRNEIMDNKYRNLKEENEKHEKHVRLLRRKLVKGRMTNMQ